MKPITYIYVLIAILISSINVYGQELFIPTQTQYLADNPFIISPAYAGIGDHIKVRLNGLTQWVGIKDAPDMQSLAGDFRIAETTGMGIFLYNDKNGFTKQLGARLSFAHHLILDDPTDQYLSLGLSYNYNLFRIDTEEFNINDLTISDIDYGNHNFDISALYRYKSFYLSLNANNVLKKEEEVFGDTEPLKLRNYLIHTGYKFKPSNKLELEPSAFIQYYESDGRSSTDLNIKARFLQRDSYYFVGLSYRFLNDQIMEPLNIGPMGGGKIENFYFAYSYQIVTNELMGFNTGTHMITLGLDIFQGTGSSPCMTEF